MFNELLIHHCFIEHEERRDKRLYFDTGTSIFDVGRLLRGNSSHAEGMIKSFEVTSGSWLLGTAAGYLILNEWIGDFYDNELITDDQPTPGSATSNGIGEENEDEFGHVSTTTNRFESICRFSSRSTRMSGSSGYLEVTESGEHFVKIYRVILPPDVTIAVGSLIYGDGSEGYSGTYRVENVDYIYDGRRLRHIGCDVREVI